MVLCEKEVALGGILKSEIALPFKREMFALTETYERFARNAGVEIRLNTEVTPEYVEKEAPDALIIAAGSRPLVPPIKGMDGEQVVVVNELYRNLDKISDKVVVMAAASPDASVRSLLAWKEKKSSSSKCATPSPRMQTSATARCS